MLIGIDNVLITVVSFSGNIEICIVDIVLSVSKQLGITFCGNSDNRCDSDCFLQFHKFGTVGGRGSS